MTDIIIPYILYLVSRFVIWNRYNYRVCVDTLRTHIIKYTCISDEHEPAHVVYVKLFYMYIKRMKTPRDYVCVLCIYVRMIVCIEIYTIHKERERRRTHAFLQKFIAVPHDTSNDFNWRHSECGEINVLEENFDLVSMYYVILINVYYNYNIKFYFIIIYRCIYR